MNFDSLRSSRLLTLFASIGLAALWSSAGGAPAEAAEPGPKLRHVVFFKFKAGTTPEKLKEITDAFAALPSKIDAIRDFEWGTDVSVENLSKGFTHCFFVTFDDEKGRDAYLPHPAHKAFVDLVKPQLDDVCVVDYRETRPKSTAATTPAATKGKTVDAAKKASKDVK